MKKKLPLIATISSLLLITITACSANESNTALLSENTLSSETALTTENVDATTSATAINATSTTLSLDRDNIFTSRDLEQNVDITNAKAIQISDNSTFTITEEGIYLLSGTATNFTVKVEASKQDKVQIALDNANITNDNFPVIYVKSADKCFVTSVNSNNLSVTNAFVADGDINTDAVIFSKDDLTFNGTGTLNIKSNDKNGISCKDNLKITSGNYNIFSQNDSFEANNSICIYGGNFVINSNKDAFQVNNDNNEGSIYIKNGTFTINASDDCFQATTFLVVDNGVFELNSAEGIEANLVQINDGNFTINASDDGINATNKGANLDCLIEINGGDFKIKMAQGDTDALDANGKIIINGGTLDIEARSAFDADLGSTYNGGTIIINGQKVDSIPNSQGFTVHGNRNMNENMNGEMQQNRPQNAQKPPRENKDVRYNNQQNNMT